MEDKLMATDAAEQTDLDQPDPPEEEQEPGRSRFSFKSKQAKMIVLLLAVMAAEAAGFYVFIPAPVQTTTDSTTDGLADESGANETPAPTAETIEVPIGTFNCTNSRANPGAVNHVSFDLVAVVATDQAANFERLANEQHKARVRQAVIKVVRSANLEDLDDPNLSAVRRLIREEINKVLQQSMVIEVVISDFTRMEQ